jgi:hypothetical protein
MGSTEVSSATQVTWKATESRPVAGLSQRSSAATVRISATCRTPATRSRTPATASRPATRCSRGRSHSDCSSFALLGVNSSRHERRRADPGREAAEPSPEPYVPVAQAPRPRCGAASPGSPAPTRGREGLGHLPVAEPRAHADGAPASVDLEDRGAGRPVSRGRPWCRRPVGRVPGPQRADPGRAGHEPAHLVDRRGSVQLARGVGDVAGPVGQSSRHAVPFLVEEPARRRPRAGEARGRRGRLPVRADGRSRRA